MPDTYNLPFFLGHNEEKLIWTEALDCQQIGRLSYIDYAAIPGSSSAGVQKTSAGVELGICRVYPICTPNELLAYAGRIRCTPDELFFFRGSLGGRAREIFKSSNFQRAYTQYMHIISYKYISKYIHIMIFIILIVFFFFLRSKVRK